MSETTYPRLTHPQIMRVLVGLMLGMFLAALDQTIVATAIRTIGDDLHGLSVQVWVTTAYLITATLSTPLYGKFSDVYGRKPFFLIAITVFVVGSAACAFATSMSMLAGFRALQGLGAGGLFSLALAIVGDIVPARERARYQGYFLAVFGTSSVLGPVIGGFFAGTGSLLSVTGWRWVFLVNVPIGIIALAVVARSLRLPHVRRDHRIDWLGVLTLAICLVPLLTVAEQGRDWGWTAQRTLICYAVGAFGLLAFVAAEARAGEDALIPLRMFRNRTFGISSAASVITGAGMFGGLVSLPLYLQIVRGASPTRAGLLLLPLTAGIMVASVVSGQLISRTGRYRVFPMLGALLMVGGMWLLHTVGVDTAFWVTGSFMAAFGLGLGFILQPITLAVQNAMPPADIGVATASATFFRQVGGTLGTAAFLSVLFSTVGDKISTAVTAAARTPAFQAAVGDSAADPADQRVLDLLRSGGHVSGSALDDTSFMQRLDPVLARPFKIGFSDSMDLVFLLAAGVLVLSFLLLLALPGVPLRARSDPEPQEAGPEAAEPVPSVTTGSPAAPRQMTAGSSTWAPRHLAADADRSVSGVPAKPPSAAPPLVGPARVEPPSTGPARVGPARVESPSAGQARTESPSAGPARVGAPRVEPSSGALSGAGTQDTGRTDGVLLAGLVCGPDGRPVADAALTVTDFRGGQLARGRSGANGRYAMKLSIGGPCLLICAAEQHQPIAVMVTVVGPTQHHDVTLGGASGIAGLIYRSSGEGVANATVTLTDLAGDVVRAAASGPDGRYQMSGLYPGDYTLTVSADGARPVARTVTVETTDVLRVDVPLATNGALRGVIRAGRGDRPVPDAAVTLVDASGGLVASAVTGEDGGYAFADLPPGRYTLIASGYPPVASRVDLAGERSEHLDVALGVAAARTGGAATYSVPPAFSDPFFPGTSHPGPGTSYSGPGTSYSGPGTSYSGPGPEAGDPAMAPGEPVPDDLGSLEEIAAFAAEVRARRG